jgi:TonB family protein
VAIDPAICSAREKTSSHLTVINMRNTVVAIFTVCLSCVAAAHGSQHTQKVPEGIIRKSAAVLREEAIKRVEPTYPPLARATKVTGSVTVEIFIDYEGNVASARAIAGHPLLKDSAVVAARQWKYRPTEVSGKPVRVIGTLVFKFSLEGQPDREHYPANPSIGELRQKVHDHPDSYKARFDLGAAYFSADRLNEAISELREAIRIDPKSQEALMKLGSAYVKLGDDDAAAEAFSRTIQIDPDYFENDGAYLGLGLICIRKAQYEEAIMNFTKVLSISPQLANAHLGLGVAYAMLGRYNDSIVALKRVFEVAPDDAAAHFCLGRVYLEIGDRASALKEYDALKRINAEMAEMLLREINVK